MRLNRLLAAFVLFSAASFAQGTLVLAGKTYILTEVYARTGPDPYSNRRTVTVVLAVDRALSPEVRNDPRQVSELARLRKLNAVEIELHEDGASWVLLAGGARISGSKTPNPFPIKLIGRRASGLMKWPGKDSFSFTVNAAVETVPVVAPPTAADEQSAVGSAAAQAYLRYVNALFLGDAEALAALVEPARAAGITDNPEFAKMLGFLQEMEPRNIVIRKAVESAVSGEATLTVTGTKSSGRPAHGEIGMRLFEGRWVLVEENWKN